MSRKLYLTASITLLFVAIVGFAPYASAERGSSNTSTDSSGRSTTKTETENETEVEHGTETEVHRSGETEAEHENRVAEKRAELQLKLTQQKESRKSSLDDNRKSKCEKREAKINSIIQKRSEQGTKHLAKFNSISERVQQFVSDKNLTIADYDALVQAINDKKAAAEAAIAANTENTFSCATTDGSEPAKLSRTTIDAVRDALKEYRTAIKDLIVKVKASTPDSSDDSSTTGGTQ